MAGLYIHIPFCKKACHYCNFHFSTNVSQKAVLVESILKELQIQKDFLQGVPLQSIYFGGGTPSLLSEEELGKIFDRIYALFPIADNPEITLEANPDDLTKSYLKVLEQSPINRLSIGVQSFHEEDLVWMNRAHNALQVKQALEMIGDFGFENYSIDLIYGSPSTTDKMWEENLEATLQLKVPHISAYALTVEEGTALGSWVKNGKVEPMDTERALAQFGSLQKRTTDAGYRHYEVSNLATPGFEAVHNGNYWRRVPYLGVGPSAHSFSGHTRQWNIKNNAKYIEVLSRNSLSFEKEELSKADQFNEYIMTGLRVDWGISKKNIAEQFPEFSNAFLEELKGQVKIDAVIENGDSVKLNPAARFLADGIASEFFIVND